MNFDIEEEDPSEDNKPAYQHGNLIKENNNEVETTSRKSEPGMQVQEKLVPQIILLMLLQRRSLLR